MKVPASLGRVWRGTKNLARRARDLIPGQYYGYSLISPVLSGIIVTPQTALTMTAVYSAITVISTDVAKLPFTLNRHIAGGGQETLRTDPRNRLVAFKPNEESNAFRYRQHGMGHVLGWGNHYSEIIRDGSGMPIALWPLHPATVRPMRTEKNKALYYEDINTGKKWMPENILHIAGLGFDGIMGYSPTTMARQAIGLGIATEQFGAALFGNGAKPGGILRTPKRLSADAAKRLRETFENIHAGTLNAHRTAVIEEGTEWINTQINPDDAQFLATRQFQVTEVARIFNIPPNKLQDYSQAHLANVEESNLDYLSTTLQGWLEAIEAEFNAKLLFDDEQGELFFSHNMNALMRANMAARGTYYESRFRVGSISPDEIRTKEGENPIGPEKGGDQYLVQSQYIPLDQAGKIMAAKAGVGDPPADPPAKIKRQRMNPHHGEDGRFSDSGGALLGRANGLGETLADHEDPVGELLKEPGHVAPSDWQHDAREQHASLLKDQAAAVKEHDRDQAGELKTFNREQVKEGKEFDRDQAKEAGEFKREQTKDARDFDRGQSKEAKDFERDPEDKTHDEFASEQHGDKEAFHAGQQQDREDFVAGQEKDKADFHEEQAGALADFHQDQADATVNLRDNHRDERKELISDLAIEMLETYPDDGDGERTWRRNGQLKKTAASSL